MKKWFRQRLNSLIDPEIEEANGEPYAVTERGAPGSGLLESLQGSWQWEDLAAEIRQEGQARVGFVGLPNAGKSTLFNRLRGWAVSEPAWIEEGVTAAEVLPVESYGAFVLADLPVQIDPALLTGEELILSLGDPGLFLYLVDGTTGVRRADYRWVALLRATGRPLMVVLNKCDVVENVDEALAAARYRLGMEVISISAATGENVETVLLPAMLDAAPKIAISLGREISCLRQTAARRVIRQAALLTALMSAQPIPLLDLPFQAIVQVGVVLRVGAAYGRSPGGGMNREVVGTVASSLSMNYLAQSIAKFIPLLGWAASSMLGAGATLLIGEAAIRYYEAGGTIPLRELISRQRQGLSRQRQRAGAWARRKIKREKRAERNEK